MFGHYRGGRWALIVGEKHGNGEDLRDSLKE